MDENKEIQQERREARRKRRIRNQIIAYIVIAIFMIALILTAVFTINYVKKASQAKKEEKQISQEILDDMLSSEEAIVLPDPEPVEEQIVEMTPMQKLDEIVNAGIEVMPLEDKVAGLFIVSPEALTGVSAAVRAGESTRQALSDYAVGGILYSAKNIQTEEQFKEMLDNTDLFTKYPIFLCVEEEGGLVSTIANSPIWEQIYSADMVGQTNNENVAYEVGVAIGSKLSELGINLNLAPVADLNTVENSVIGKRSYGADAQNAGSMVAAMVHGLADNKVASCLKHFPGMGSVTVDPHKAISVTDRTQEQFREEDFSVFRAGIDAGVNMVMVSCIAAPALTDNSEPCIFSERVVTDILRTEMAFEGVIITDALNMAAVANYYGADEAAIMALKAGCDMLLMPENFEKAYNGVLNAVREGTISEERINDALRRIYRIKYADKIE